MIVILISLLSSLDLIVVQTFLFQLKTVVHVNMQTKEFFFFFFLFKFYVYIIIINEDMVVIFMYCLKA